MIRCTYGISFKKNEDNYLDKNTITGKVIDITKMDDYYTFIIKEKEKIICYYYDDFEYEYGDTVTIYGKQNKLYNNTIPGEINYKNYLYNKGIYSSVTVEKIKLNKKNNNLMFNLKNILFNKIKNDSKESKYIKTLLFGKNEISDCYKELYRKNGINHLFSISSMHLSMLCLMITFFLRLFKFNNKIEFIVLNLFIVFYIFITNFQASVLRSGVFLMINKIRKILKYDNSPLQILTLTICLILIINPFTMFNIGFIFSTTTSFFLIAFSNLLNGNYFIKLLKSSLLVYIVTLPFISYFFYEVNYLSFIYNIFYIPYVSIIIFPLCIISYTVPKITFILSFFINILEKTNILLNNVDSIKVVGKCNYIIIAIYYIIIILLIKQIMKKRKKYIILIILTVLLFMNYKNLFKNEKIVLFDVGQGDSALINTKNGNLLIDTGGSFYNNVKYSKKIINSAKFYGISKLNYMIFTHGDYDHMGEAINLVNNIKVENVIFNCGTFNKLEQELIKVLDKKKIKYYSCIKEINIDNRKLQFLNTREYDDENDNSNVIYFKYNNYKFLFMGDAGIEKEKDLLDKFNLKDIDFIKIGHHGSNTSSSKRFINSINPKYSFISVGKNNRYGHPKEEVLETLKNSKIYRTDLDGSIEIKLNKNGYKIRTCPL